MSRHFTPEQAAEALEEVRPLAEEMVAHRRALAEATRKRGRIVTRIAGNGGGLDSSALDDLQDEQNREAAAIVRCVEAIQELGAVVKDLDEGLVDFPALRGDEEVLLCWRVGEPEIAYWHGLEEGFAGRKPLPFD